MELPAVELDDHLLVREQGVDLIAGDGRAHQGLREPVALAEGGERVFPFGACRAALGADELLEPLRAWVAREALDHVGELVEAEDPGVTGVVDGSGERFFGEGGGGVEQRARGARDADVVVGAEVFAGQAFEAVGRNALVPSITWDDDFDASSPVRQAPERQRGAVAERRALAAREDGCRRALDGGSRGPADRVDAFVDAVQATNLEAIFDLLDGHPQP